MTNIQLFFAIAGVFITTFGLVFGVFASLSHKYLEAKFTAIDNQLKFITDHIVLHIDKIARLEERTKDK